MLVADSEASRTLDVIVRPDISDQNFDRDGIPERANQVACEPLRLREFRNSKGVSHDSILYQQPATGRLGRATRPEAPAGPLRPAGVALF